MDFSNFFILLLIIIGFLPIIASSLLLIYFIFSPSRPSNKFKARRENFYLIKKNYNIPKSIYIEKYTISEHHLFLEFDNVLILISEYLPGNLELAFMSVELYLKEIYGNSITDIKLKSNKYDCKNEIKIDFKMTSIHNNTNTTSLDEII